ncbi:MAG: AbrB/MazE/SpoVT family DNA-binding domain-containing protein [Gemmatimonadota bacterium]|jgi:AbrB family looped-hinge helix DNA binding protein
MSKVTSKRQVTIPKEVADRYGIDPGDEIRWIPAGDEIRVVPESAGRRTRLGIEERLRLFDRASQRRERRADECAGPEGADEDRGWTREELYDRGRPG